MKERTDPPPHNRRTALVLSGGGATGAYEVGVMKALFSGVSPAAGRKPLHAGSFVGTSVGAYNASFMAAQEVPEADAAARLEEIWRRRIADTFQSCGNGVFRLRALPLQGLDPGCLMHPLESLADWAKDGAALASYSLRYGRAFARSDQPIPVRLIDSVNLEELLSPEPLYNLVRETVQLQGLSASPKDLTVAATNWESGHVRVFSKAEILQVGHQAILASAAIPGVFPHVYISGVPYADGGVTMNTPLQPAIQAGAEEIHAIYLDPFVDDIPLPRPPNTLETLTRLFVIQFANQMNSDVFRAQRINRALELLDKGSKDRPRLQKDLARLLDLDAERFSGGRAYRSLTIHRYRPARSLTNELGMLGWLDFSAANIARLIQQGIQDAMQHDCEAAECVLVAETGKTH